MGDNERGCDNKRDCPYGLVCIHWVELYYKICGVAPLGNIRREYSQTGLLLTALSKDAAPAAIVYLCDTGTEDAT